MTTYLSDTARAGRISALSKLDGKRRFEARAVGSLSETGSQIDRRSPLFMSARARRNMFLRVG